MTDLCPIDRMIADLIAEVGPEHARAVLEERVTTCTVVELAALLENWRLWARPKQLPRGDLARGRETVRAGVLIASPAEVYDLLRFGGHLRGTPFRGVIIWDKDAHDEERAKLDVELAEAERKCEGIRERIAEHDRAVVG